MIVIIAAVAKNRAIGYKNKLIYSLPDDLKRFKRLTSGHTVIMGSNTFRSLPNGPLPNRRNIVLSHNKDAFNGCDVDVYTSLEEALSSCTSEETVFIIGGASVYQQALDVADMLLLTEIDDTPTDADAFFPDYSDWKEISRESHKPDSRHAYHYAFVEYAKPWIDRLMLEGAIVL